MATSLITVPGFIFTLTSDSTSLMLQVLEGNADGLNNRLPANLTESVDRVFISFWGVFYQPKYFWAFEE